MQRIGDAVTPFRPNLLEPSAYLGYTKLDDEISWAGGFDRNSEKWCNAACSLALVCIYWIKIQCS